MMLCNSLWRIESGGGVRLVEREGEREWRRFVWSSCFSVGTFDAEIYEMKHG